MLVFVVLSILQRQPLMVEMIVSTVALLGPHIDFELQPIYLLLYLFYPVDQTFWLL